VTGPAGPAAPYPSSMRVGETIGVAAAVAAWRLTRSPRAARRLTDAVEHGEEVERDLAATALCRGGDPAVDAVAQALDRGASSPVLVDVLASVDTPRARGLLDRLTTDRGPLAEEARQALHVLDDLDRDAEGP
jgi:hypothetical protein